MEQKLSKNGNILHLVADCAKEMCRDEGWFNGMARVLERLGQGLALNRIYVAENLTKEACELRASIQHEWINHNLRQPPGGQKKSNFLGSEEQVNYWWKSLVRKNLLATPLNDFPPKARAVLGSVEEGALLAVLLVVAGKPWGFLACHAQGKHCWSSEEATVLQLVAEILAASIERSHKLRRITERREKLAGLVEEIPEIFWTVELNRPKLLYVSPSFERMWGCLQEEIARDPLGFLHHAFPEDKEHAGSVFQFDFLQKQKNTVIHEDQFRVLAPGSELRWISVRYSILSAEDEATGLIMGLAADITEHKQQELFRLKQKELLIREAHHRIKNHLQGLAGLLQQYSDQSPQLAQPMQAAISQVISVAAIHELQTIHDGGKLKLEEAVAAICHNTGKIANCLICFNRAAVDAPVIMAEQEAVPVVLIVSELVLNACKHRDVDSAEVRVWMKRGISRKNVELRIRNEQARLGKEFDFSSGQGLGTGLKLVKSLLPPTGARLTIQGREGGVEALLELSSPILQLS